MPGQLGLKTGKEYQEAPRFTEKINNQVVVLVVVMTACNKELIAEDKASYVREEYLKLQREKEQYLSLDDYCAKRGID